MAEQEYYIVAFYSEDRKHWYYEKMFCSFLQCQLRCEEIIADESNLYSKYGISNPAKLINCLHLTFLTTPYVYLPETNEWYHPFEDIPYPKSEALITKKFNIKVSFDKFYKEEQFENYQYVIDSKYDELYQTALDFNIKFITYDGKQNWGDWYSDAQSYLKHLLNQFKRLKKHKQTVLYYSECSYTILWEKDNYIRVIGGWEGETKNEFKYFDCLVPKDNFYTEIDKMFEQAQKLIIQDINDYKKYLKLHGYPEDYKVQELNLENYYD